MDTRLVVVVDTEEDWLDEWDRPTSVSNISVLPEVHEELFAPLGVRPTYLLTYPVVTDSECSAIFRALLARNDCEVGAHVHNWTSPPFTEADRRKKSYHTDVESDVERKKIADLAGVIEGEIGVRPVTFKGGRWGANGRTIRHLEDLGFKTDTSVQPVTDLSGNSDGPDFMDAPFHPYFPSHEDILVPDPEADPERAVLELPVTVGFKNPDFEGQLALMKRVLGNPVLPRLRTVGIMHFLGLMRRIKLSQETSTVREMKQVVDAALARKHAVLNLTFHSCVLKVGCSPYSRKPAETAAGRKRLGEILEYIVRERGVRPATCREVRETWLA